MFKLLNRCGLLVALTIFAMSFATAAAPESPKLAIGDKAPLITFTDIHYLPRTLADFGEKKAIVIAFMTLECPVAQRYLPRLKSLDESFRDRGVQFLALNIGSNDSLVEVAYQAVQADWSFPVGKDFAGAAAKSLGATRTPEVAVLDAQGRLRYRGRIDNQIRLGGVRPAADREDLVEALEDILAGRDVRVSETPVDGCFLEFASLTGLPARTPTEVTYSEHVAPVLARHCQECHHVDGSAPFPLVTYQETLAHADTVAEVVQQQRMPPSFASRAHGGFVNRRDLSDAERALVMAWARQGKPEGDPAKLPPSREFSTSKWTIGEPDQIIRMTAPFAIPAEGYVPYHYELLPYPFLHDTWVQGVQILPGNKAAVHHCNMGYISIGGANENSNFITGFVPGGDAMNLSSGVGFKIPAGSMLVLQIHYVVTGKPTTDQSSVGLVYARETIDKQLQHFQCVAHRFKIPPGASHYPLKGERTFSCDATGVGMFTHMHLRGKDIVFRAFPPNGQEEVLLAVPNYDFNWQMAYRWPAGQVKFAKGTRVECTAHFDNSAFNPFNPDPKATVVEGPQTFNEMMYGFLFYTDDSEHLNLTIDRSNGRVIKKPPTP